MTDYWTLRNEVRGYYVAWDAGDGKNFYVQQHTIMTPGDAGVFKYEHGNRTIPEAVMHLYRGQSWGSWEHGVSEQKRGTYHPRVLRETRFDAMYPMEMPPFDRLYTKQMAASRASARNLFVQLDEVFRYIEPAPATMNTYGDRLRSLLILASAEVESSWKAILAANNGLPKPKPNKPHKDRATTNDYVKLLGPMRLDEWGVKLALYPEYPEIKPFAAWTATDPTESLKWYDAYNEAKHSREEKLHRATLEHVISAMAAVLVMHHAQFGWYAYPDWMPFFDGMYPESWPKWSMSEIYLPPERNGAALGTWTPEPLFP